MTSEDVFNLLDKYETSLPLIRVLNKDGSIKEVRQVTKEYKLESNEEFATLQEFKEYQIKTLPKSIKKFKECQIREQNRQDQVNEQHKKNRIWNRKEDKKGNFVKWELSQIDAANVLMEETKYKTFGDKNKEMRYFENGVYRLGGDKRAAARIQLLTEGILKNNDVVEIIGHIQRNTYTDRAELENTPINYVCVNNGILDIDFLKNEVKLLPHNSNIIFTHKLPVCYKPDAKCNKIIEFLESILKPEDISVIQEFIGFCLYRRYHIKKSLIFVGESNTGKTTLIKLIVALIGNENTSGVSLHRILYDKFASSALYQMLLNFYDDLSFKDIKETGAFKIACGGGFLSGEKKFGDQFQFLNYAKLLFATNKISCVDDTDDDAYYDRWLIIFFNNVFDDNNPNTDKHLIDKLTTEEELSGFLNWALEGLFRLLKNNRFSYDKTAEDNKLIMERSSNTISAFVQDCLKEAPGFWIPKDDMYLLYSEYVSMYGGVRVSKESFGRELPKKALYLMAAQREVNEKKNAYVWFNVSLIEEVPDNLSELIPLTPFLKLIYYKLISVNTNTFFKTISKKNGIKGINKTPKQEDSILLDCVDCGHYPSTEWINGKPVCKVCYEINYKVVEQ